MLALIIKILFLFPFIYCACVIIEACFLTGGIFFGLIAIIFIGVISLSIWASAKAMQTRHGRYFLNQRNQKEEKEINDFGIIDYFDEDK